MINSLSSRSLAIAVVAFTAIFLGAFVVFAVSGGGALTDPAEILSRGAEATSQADSFHLTVTMDGNLTDPETGTTIPLDGVTVEGDVDVAGAAADITFAVPAMFGLSGEAVVIGPDRYLKTSMTGPMWMHTTAGDGDEPMLEPPNPGEVAEKVNEFLATEGVVGELLADEPCENDTCYHVRLTIPAEAMAHHEDADEMGDYGNLVPEDAFAGPLVVDLLFDRNGLWLRQVSTSAASDEAGDVSLTLALSNYNQSVDISAPPADEVTEGGDFPLFSDFQLVPAP